MAKQSIINQTELTNFLANGALLQVSADQFKLIWGPFHPQTFNVNEVADQKTIIYKPDFWDFLDLKAEVKNTFVGNKELVVKTELLLELLNQQENVEFDIQWSSVETNSFQEQFRWSQDQFRAGRLIKTVPIISQSGILKITAAHLSKALKTVVAAGHYGATYGFWETKNDGLHGFLGHTPELILDWHQVDQKIKTMALAGTMDHKPENVDLIMKDKKIIDEHQFVVVDLMNALASVSEKHEIQEQKTKVLELKYLFHLQTLIEVAEIKLDDVKKFIDTIHPTAALGLYPRIKHAYLEFKEFNLQFNRKNFAAPFAFFSPDQIKAIAAIRLFYFTPFAVEIVSGCGVTKDSVFQDELDELTSKRNSVKKMMGMNL